MTLGEITLVSVLVLAAAAHFVSIGAVLARFYSHRPAAPSRRPPVTILRPAAGMENYIAETMDSAFALDYPDFEIIFCVQDRDDPIVALIGRLMESHPEISSRLLIGDDPIGNNPKLNNLAKGWLAARHEWIVMADSNVLIPPTYLDELLSCWTDKVGLVSSPPAGAHPDGIAGELECAFLNTYQARWQLAADAFGVAYAHGKTMLLRRSMIDQAGGLAALASATAEDIAATTVVRAAGLQVRLTKTPFPQPIGRRSLTEVWRRQMRWAQLRREGLGLVFWVEPLSFASLILIAAAFATWAWGLPASILFALVVSWYGAEGILARAYRWPLSFISPFLWIARDLLLPVLWLVALTAREYEWHGHRIAVAPKRERRPVPPRD